MNEDEICKLYESGKSLRDISLMYDCSPQIIRRILVENGILIRGKGHVNSDNHPWKMPLSSKAAANNNLIRKELSKL